MNWKKIGYGCALFDFSALSAYAVWTHGYIGFFEASLSTTGGAVVFVDLCIALTMVMTWMWRDAKSNGMSPVPYIALTLTLGSVGPLSYLMMREFALEATPEYAAVPA